MFLLPPFFLSRDHGFCPVRRYVKELVFYGGQYRQPSSYAFRCLICEGFRYLHTRTRDQKSIELRRQYAMYHYNQMVQARQTILAYHQQPWPAVMVPQHHFTHPSHYYYQQDDQAGAGPLDQQALIVTAPVAVI